MIRPQPTKALHDFTGAILIDIRVLTQRDTAHASLAQTRSQLATPWIARYAELNGNMPPEAELVLPLWAGMSSLLLYGVVLSIEVIVVVGASGMSWFRIRPSMPPIRRAFFTLAIATAITTGVGILNLIGNFLQWAHYGTVHQGAGTPSGNPVWSRETGITRRLFDNWVLIASPNGILGRRECLAARKSGDGRRICRWARIASCEWTCQRGRVITQRRGSSTAARR